MQCVNLQTSYTITLLSYQGLVSVVKSFRMRRALLVMLGAYLNSTLRILVDSALFSEFQDTSALKVASSPLMNANIAEHG